MSAATMSGSEAVKAAPAASKQQVKNGSTSNSGKALDGARKQAASPVDGQSRKQQPPQPRAWQGPNPITQRASTSTPNGTEKNAPKPQTQSQAKSTTESNAEKHAHDRALYLLACFTGHDATVTLKTGEQFTGIFSGGSFDTSKQQYILKMVKRTRLPAHQQVNGNIDIPSEYVGEGEDYVMAFDKEDTTDLYVPDVAPLTARPVQNGSISSSFRTDTEISARDTAMPLERELQRWDAGADSSIDMSLGASGETGWDQFAVNERMYGVQSTYDEDIYTTQINRSDPRYRQREAEAERIAREIESSTASNPHVAEERRRDAERGEGLDEEEKYSGVQRETTALPKRAAGAYVPPSQRAITNVPTVPGAPFDPAIISLEKPAPSGASEKAVEPLKTPELTTEQKTPQTEPQAFTSKLAVQTSQIPKKATESTMEDHVRNVTDSFKLFANNEKLKIRQAQEAKRSNARAEKTVRINDLKKFSANFKLKSRVPDDLVPILAKDRDKQLEIQQKAEEAAKQAEVSKQKKKEQQGTGEPTSPAPSNTASQAGTTMSASQAPSSRGARISQNTMRGGPPSFPLQSPSRSGGLQQNRAYGRPGFPPAPQPLPADLRIPPPAPSLASAEAGPRSPSKGLDAGAPAFVFRPAASAFNPSNASSQERSEGKADAKVPDSADFFKDRKSNDPKTRKDLNQSFNPLKRMLAAEYTDEQKKSHASNGGIPNPYRTPPTWPVENEHRNISYKDSIPKAPEPSHTHSQMHTPNPSTGQMPHAHQLPAHMQGPQPPTPSGRPPFIPPPHHQHPQGYGPGMPHFGPNGSLQNSPRFPQAQMAFNGQMQGMPMPQFAGGQMQGYQMSPNMQYRQMQMPPQGPMMMMGGHPQGQMPMQPQPYPRGPGGGPQGYNPQMMPGGVPMSGMPGNPNGGPPGTFMQGPPMPGQQGGPNSYSPMPHHPQPHMHAPHGNPYGGSPRPPAGHMMQHTTSHQGFQQGAHMGHMGAAGAPGMMGAGGMMGGNGGGMGYAPPPGGPHPGHYMQARQMSHGGYPQMTPRQGQAVPVGGGGGGMHASPGAPGGGGQGMHGDEGK